MLERGWFLLFTVCVAQPGHHAVRRRSLRRTEQIGTAVLVLDHLSVQESAFEAALHDGRFARFDETVTFVTFDLDVSTRLTVACEAEHLDEMLGNLLDNAFKWSRSKVNVSAGEAGPDAIIAIGVDSVQRAGIGIRDFGAPAQQKTVALLS